MQSTHAPFMAHDLLAGSLVQPAWLLQDLISIALPGATVCLASQAIHVNAVA